MASIDKDSVLALIDDLRSNVVALADAGSPDVAALQQQIADLSASLSDAQKKTDDAVAALSVEVAKEADVVVHAQNLQSKIDSAIAALQASEVAPAPSPAPEAPQS